VHGSNTRFVMLCVFWTTALLGCKSTSTAVSNPILQSDSVSAPRASVEPLKRQANDEPRCPAPSKEVQTTCRAITYRDLPDGAKALLRQLKCDTAPRSNYNYGTAVDLNGDGIPEYQFCCHEAAHGPCSVFL
jgi:hypothetical protein